MPSARRPALPPALPSARAARRPADTPDAAALAGRTDLAPAEAKVLRKFRIVFNAVKTHFQQVERKAGIGGAQLWALSVIRTQPGIGVSALAQALDVHQTTASNLVRALVSMGFVEVLKNGPDRRTVQLKLLPDGAKVLRRAPGPFHGVLPEALARLDRQTLQRLDKDLAQLIEALHADESGGTVPLGQK